MLETAGQAASRGDHQQSVEILERASRLDPGNPNSPAPGSVYGKRYDSAAAEGCFEKAVRFTTRKTELLAWPGSIAGILETMRWPNASFSAPWSKTMPRRKPW